MPEYDPEHIRQFDVEKFPKGKISKKWLHIISDGIGEPIRVPVMIARGEEAGPTVGLTAALHGNELNGIPVIQRVFKQLNLKELKGNLVGVLITNVPGVLLGQRRFSDDVDLNWIAPGKSDGNQGELYISRIIEGIVRQFDYLIDLHTLSFGRVSTHYVLADMTDSVTARMAILQNPNIILNSVPSATTLRGHAARNGIKSITAELKDPHLFQTDVIEDATVGIRNILIDLKMQAGQVICPMGNVLQCKEAYWIYTDKGGLLTIFPNVGTLLSKGDLIAEVKTVFGKVIQKYYCPEDGIVIAKSVNPINQSGSRIIHLGLRPKNIPCIAEHAKH